MKILGVDPGLRVTGYGVINFSETKVRESAFELIEAGIIKTTPKIGIAGRLAQIYDSLASVVSELKPDVIVIEKLYAHYKHPATAILMGHARGAVCLLSGREGVPLVSIAATHVKKSVTGKGHAPKRQIQRMVQYYLSLKEMPEPPDVADALAIAIAHAFSQRKNG